MVFQIYTRCKERQKCKAKIVALWLSVVRGSPDVDQFDLTTFESHLGVLLHKLNQLKSFVAQYEPGREFSSDLMMAS